MFSFGALGSKLPRLAEAEVRGDGHVRGSAMIGDTLELATSDAAQIDDRIATACILVAERPDLVTGVWVCGLVRCGETFAGVRAAQLRWDVTITDESPNGSPAMTVRIRRSYDRHASLADGHGPYAP